MSSYLNIYVRVRSDLYKIERIKDTEYHKQGDVILFDSYSRNCKIYRIVSDCINPVWAGEEEKYSVLTKDGIDSCIIECQKEIKSLRDSIDKYKSKREEYIKYLQGLPKVLSYEEFTNSITEEDWYIEETKEELEDYEYCLNQLQFIQDFINTCNLKYGGFSEVLCNIG
jgi:hypothetical protein